MAPPRAGSTMGADTGKEEATATSTTFSRRLLLAVAGAMTAAAMLAIGIVLFGDFDGTAGRVLLTTVLLALHAALAVPAAVLWDQRRLPWLAAACAGLAAAGAALNAAGIWSDGGSETLGKAIGTTSVLLLATVVTAALATRPRHALYLPSVAVAYLAAAMAAVAIWTETESEAYLRLLGAVVVLAVLLVALQPVLRRLERERRRPAAGQGSTGGGGSLDPLR